MGTQGSRQVENLFGQGDDFSTNDKESPRLSQKNEDPIQGLRGGERLEYGTRKVKHQSCVLLERE